MAKKPANPPSVETAPSDEVGQGPEKNPQAGKAPEGGTHTTASLALKPGKRSLEDRQAEAQAKHDKRIASSPRQRTAPPTEASSMGQVIADLGIEHVMRQHPGEPNYPVAIRAFESAVLHLKQQWRHTYQPAWLTGDK